MWRKKKTDATPERAERDPTPSVARWTPGHVAPLPADDRAVRAQAQGLSEALLEHLDDPLPDEDITYVPTPTEDL